MIVKRDKNADLEFDGELVAKYREPARSDRPDVEAIGTHRLWQAETGQLVLGYNVRWIYNSKIYNKYDAKTYSDIDNLKHSLDSSNASKSLLYQIGEKPTEKLESTDRTTLKTTDKTSTYVYQNRDS